MSLRLRRVACSSVCSAVGEHALDAGCDMGTLRLQQLGASAHLVVSMVELARLLAAGGFDGIKTEASPPGSKAEKRPGGGIRLRTGFLGASTRVPWLL